MNRDHYKNRLPEVDAPYKTPPNIVTAKSVYGYYRIIHSPDGAWPRGHELYSGAFKKTLNLGFFAPMTKVRYFSGKRSDEEEGIYIIVGECGIPQRMVKLDID